MKARHAAQVLSLAAVLAACGTQQKKVEVADCPFTRADNPAGHHGETTGILIIIPGSGKILALRRRQEAPPGDHLITESIDADGTIRIKFPIWTGPDADGRLRITGRSVDGRPGRVRGEYARAPRDFHAGYLVFPGEGCWRVTAHAGASILTFVTEVLDCRRECVEL